MQFFMVNAAQYIRYILHTLWYSRLYWGVQNIFISQFYLWNIYLKKKYLGCSQYGSIRVNSIFFLSRDLSCCAKNCFAPEKYQHKTVNLNLPHSDVVLSEFKSKCEYYSVCVAFWIFSRGEAGLTSVSHDQIGNELCWYGSHKGAPL